MSRISKAKLAAATNRATIPPISGNIARKLTAAGIRLEQLQSLGGFEQRSFKLNQTTPIQLAGVSCPANEVVVRLTSSCTEFHNSLLASRHQLAPAVLASWQQPGIILWQRWGQSGLPPALLSAGNNSAPASNAASLVWHKFRRDFASIAGWHGCYRPEAAAHQQLQQLPLSRQLKQDCTELLVEVFAAYQATARAAVHGDFNPDNLLYQPSTGPAGFELRCIDFSFSGCGDANWDCASMLLSSLDKISNRARLASPLLPVNSAADWPNLLLAAGWLAMLWYLNYARSSHASSEVGDVIGFPAQIPQARLAAAQLGNKLQQLQPARKAMISAITQAS